MKRFPLIFQKSSHPQKMAVPSGIIYEFADFRLIPSEGLLLRRGEPVQLSLKAFATLAMLVERHGHLVAKTELIDSVWSDTFVEEAAVSRCVWNIRHALGEDSKSSSLIQTVSRRGYRFVAPVTVLNDPVNGTAKRDHLSTGYRLPIRRKNGNHEPGAASNLSGVNGRASVTADEIGEERNLGEGLAAAPTNGHRATRSRTFALFAGIATVLFIGVVLYLTLGGGSILDKSGANRIAVLPFRPVDVQQRDPNYDIGIAETLILKLSADKSLTVRQLSAVRTYLDVNEDPVKAGKEQGVDYVVSANYQLASGKIKVTSNLLDVATGTVVGTFTSQKDSTDLFAAQDAIANEVGNLILAKFGSDSQEFRWKRGTDNEEAYRNYQQAMNLFDQQRPGSLQKAIEYLDRAVDLDPNYAKGWAGKAVVSSVMSNSNRASDNEMQYRVSMEAAKKALAIDPNVSEAYAAMCDNKFAYGYDFPAAEADCKRAIALDPNYSWARSTYAILLYSRGRFDEGLSEIRTAMELEPASLRSQRIYSNGLYFARRYEEAVEVHKRLIDLNPDARSTYLFHIRALEWSGREDEAFKVLLRLLVVDKKDDETIDDVKAAYASSGWPGVLRERIKIELEEPSPNYGHISDFYGALGDKDKALEYLEKWSRNRNWNMMFLRVDPRFDPLHDDPRFQEMIRQIEG